MSQQQVTIRSKSDVIDFLNNAGPARNALIVIFTALGGVFIDAYDFTSLTWKNLKMNFIEQ